jgi:hypothetical protein
MLMRAGYPLAMIPPADRAAYFAALAEYDQGREEPLVRMFAAACERTADIMLQGLAPAPEPDLDR